ncbi:PREDICTED: elicitor peptide 4 [Camelina sativa]|uniref:Elicitor peptide 4 n=1 Tax=Camelina sativa TaxID=90675 RepID=A0ABM0XVL0_CAMSA|nr:PREDICTED: elicitor peptide 4 [Camelina sativa]
MEREGGGVSYYLWIPFTFIHQTFRSLLLKLFGLPSPYDRRLPEENEVEVEVEVEVVEVSSRAYAKPKKVVQKSREVSSGKPGRKN